MPKPVSRRPQIDPSGHWMTYSDMLSGLLLMFILLLLIFLWRFQETSRQLLIEQQVLRTIESEYTALKDEVERRIGVKAELIAELQTQFAANNIQAQIDPSGAIQLESNLFFEFNSTELKPEGQAFLARFFPIYVSVLSQDKYSGQVEEIIIQGHTDNIGTYLTNLNLSQARALSVASYCLSGTIPGITPTQLDTLQTKLTANGRSFSQPRYTTDGAIDPDASRRVEFLFRLGDEDMIEEFLGVTG